MNFLYIHEYFWSLSLSPFRVILMNAQAFAIHNGLKNLNKTSRVSLSLTPLKLIRKLALKIIEKDIRHQV